MKESPLTIYHVEDDAADRELFQMAAQRVGVTLHLTAASDGQEALQFLTTAPEPTLPNLILLDLNLPRKDGREFLSDIRENERLRTIPVVVLTTSSAPEDVRNCYQRGAACYLVKPLEFTELCGVVKKLLEFWELAEFPRAENGPPL